MGEIFNPTWSKERREKLRIRETPAEALFWQHVQGRKLVNAKFRRQHGIGPYIVDFYVREVRLVVEIDGNIHNSDKARDRDEARTRQIEVLNIEVIRFSNDSILKFLPQVLAEIAKIIETRRAAGFSFR